MSSDPTSQPNAITSAVLEARYDEIYARLCDVDATARKLRTKLEQRDKAVDEAIHQRHLVAVSLRSHLQKLKRDADAILRAEVGLKVLPGFRAKGETHAQFRARMNMIRRELGERVKQIEP